MESQPGRRGGFTGGHFGPNFNRGVWRRDINGQIFRVSLRESLMSSSQAISIHFGVEVLKCFSILEPTTWLPTICRGGAHHPQIPLYLGANTLHGKRGHPKLERDQSNKAAFLLQHFFPSR